MLSVGQRLQQLFLECGLGVEKSQYKKINIYLNMFGDGRGPIHFHAYMVENK
jgi:hypothetical protein